MSACVEFVELRKTFKDRQSGKDIHAVNRVNLQIQKGKLITLLGPSGCGKTTVLRMLAGFETPTDGDIRFYGESIKYLPPNKRNSSMVFQSYALFPHMNVEQNIAYGLKIRGIKGEEKQRRLEKIMQIVGLIGFEKRMPNEMSGGQQQRVALARALVVEPEILLFDEPLSNLDAKLRESMRSEIRDIQQRLAITSVYVTHDQVEAMAISDLIVVMNQGKIEQVGTPLEIYTRPATEFVADFMGATNLLSAQVEEVLESRTDLRVHEKIVEVPFKQKGVCARAKIKLIVRPESVLLKEKSDGLEALVKEQSFLGSHYEYSLELDNGEKLTARCPLEAGGKVFRCGQRVGVDFEEKNLHYLI